MPSTGNPSAPDPLAALADYLDSFDSGSKIRGKTYFKAARVVDLAVAGPVVRAVVQGSYDYDVELEWSDGAWVSICSCPLEGDCKHAYAAGLAWLRRHDVKSASATPAPGGPVAVPMLNIKPGEQPLVDAFTRATGHGPDRKQLAWLRNLAVLHRSVCQNPGYGHAWFDLQALHNLAPADARHRLPYDYRNPFEDWWMQPPATPLELWSFVALLFTERDIPRSEFTAPFTDLAAAQASRLAVARERQLAAWRARFASLEAAATAPAEAAPKTTPATLRLVLGAKKLSWQISPNGPAGPFRACPIDELRPALADYAGSSLEFDDGSNLLLSALRKRYRAFGRATLKLADPEDATLIGQWLGHPVARRHLVGPGGEPIEDDPRTVTWKIEDHPDDAAQVLVSPVFADGTPLPPGTVALASAPARYLCGHRLFQGVPPPDNKLAPVAIPREVLALPEAGRFAARAGLKLPGDAAGRFRHETLRARLRVTVLDHPSLRHTEVVRLDCEALAPGGEVRARYLQGVWATKGKGVQPAADAAFVLHDFSTLAAVVAHLGTLPALTWINWPEPAAGHYRECNSPSFAEHFSVWLAGVPTGVTVELDPDLAAFAAAPTRGHFALEIEESGIDWFDVQVKLRVEDTTLTGAEIALLRQAKGRFIRLAGRGWRRLEVNADPAALARLDRLGLEAETLAADPGREAQKFHALQLADEALGEALPEKLARQIRARAAEIRATPSPTLPASLRAGLRPYQVEGFHFLAHLSANRFGGILADDMGLGKTLQTLAWLLWLADEKSRDTQANVRNTNFGPDAGGAGLRALVVCPKSVVFNWEHETARFAPSLTTGRLAPRAAQPVPAGVQLVIVNYAQLRLNAEALAAETWDAVILDEGQNIKNPASATAAAARALRATHRIVLTGTPVENRLLDLWSLFAFAQPGLLGGQAAFKRLYNDRENPAAAHARLATRVRHFLLRRTKGQVARDLPPRTEEDMVVELDGPQRALYDAELKRARQMLLGVKSEREFDAQRFNILQSLLRLRQICCDPRLLGAELSAEKTARRTRAAAGETPPAKTVSAKLEALLDTLEPLLEEGHRVLVFSQFVSMLGLIRDELVARNIRHLMLTGQTENRQELVGQFQAADGPPVFLLSLKAAGSGLNLTAASYVVLYDPWWNPAVEAQAIDRTHRIGQTSHVIAYRLLARDTVEEKIRALQKEKAALAAAVVQEESLAKVLDLESLRRILG
jgi:superfamily II DNA or RNA helicase